jgi:hypothetical protein
MVPLTLMLFVICWCTPCVSIWWNRFLVLWEIQSAAFSWAGSVLWHCYVHIFRQYREHVKYLSCLSKDFRIIVLVDNNPYSFLLQPLNGIPCVTFSAAHPVDDQVKRTMYTNNFFVSTCTDVQCLQLLTHWCVLPFSLWKWYFHFSNAFLWKMMFFCEEEGISLNFRVEYIPTHITPRQKRNSQTWT